MKPTTFLLSALACLFFIASCAREDDLPTSPDLEEGMPALIHLQLKNRELETRSTGLTSAEEKKVSSIQILIFDHTGKIVTNASYSDANGLTNIQNISTLSGSNMSIYAIANLTAVNTNFTQAVNDIHNLTDMNNLIVYTTGGDMEINRKMLMWGYASNVAIPVNPGSITVSLNLSYVVSKIHVNLINNVPAGEQVTWSDWKLQDFPRLSYLIPRSSDAVNPANASDYLSSIATFAWTDTTFTVNGASKPGKATVFYLFENRRGGRTGGSPADTNPYNKNLYAPARATAIIANGFYQKSGANTGIKATIFLGANSYNDYNLERSKEYTYQITVNGINDIEIDSRIEGAASGFQASVQNTTLDCHYDWRPIRLGSFANTLSLQILDNSGLPATSTFWLKVSALNINKFVPAGTSMWARPTYNPSTDMKTSISGIAFTDATQMTFQTYYLYADEYLSEGTTRNATLRITNAQGAYVDVPITQKGYQTMGTVGMRKYSLPGVLLPTGDYKLAVENVEETGLILTPGAETGLEKTYTMQWGFPSTDMQTVLPQVVFDYYKRAGLDNTNNLVYLPSSTILRKPYPRTGENVIAENLYDPIFNTYAARYCFEKNRDTNGDGSILGDEIKWYLPSEDELALIYAGEPSLSQTSAEKISANLYYSSTESQSGKDNAIYTRFDNGRSTTTAKGNTLYVRCVRAVASGTGGLTSPYVETLSGIINNNGFKSTSLKSSAVSHPVPVHLYSDATNRTVSPRFVVAKADIVNVSWAAANGWTSAANSSSGTGTIASPATGCQAYSELGAPAGSWRVPTQRELYLIYTVRKELLSSLAGFTDFLMDGTQYWSSTTNSSSEAWTMDFALGAMMNRSKTSQYRVRCIRDL